MFKAPPNRLYATAPERVFLNVSDSPADHHGPFPNGPGVEISWSEQPAMRCAVEYVRADALVQPERRARPRRPDGKAGPMGVVEAIFLPFDLSEEQHQQLRERGFGTFPPMREASVQPDAANDAHAEMLRAAADLERCYPEGIDPDCDEAVARLRDAVSKLNGHRRAG